MTEPTTRLDVLLHAAVLECFEAGGFHSTHTENGATSAVSSSGVFRPCELRMAPAPSDAGAAPAASRLTAHVRSVSLGRSFRTHMVLEPSAPAASACIDLPEGVTFTTAVPQSPVPRAIADVLDAWRYRVHNDLVQHALAAAGVQLPAAGVGLAVPRLECQADDVLSSILSYLHPTDTARFQATCKAAAASGAANAEYTWQQYVHAAGSTARSLQTELQALASGRGSAFGTAQQLLPRCAHWAAWRDTFPHLALWSVEGQLSATAAGHALEPFTVLITPEAADEVHRMAAAPPVVPHRILPPPCRSRRLLDAAVSNAFARIKAARQEAAHLMIMDRTRGFGMGLPYRHDPLHPPLPPWDPFNPSIEPSGRDPFGLFGPQVGAGGAGGSDMRGIAPDMSDLSRPLHVSFPPAERPVQPWSPAPGGYSPDAMPGLTGGGLLQPGHAGGLIHGDPTLLPPGLPGAGGLAGPGVGRGPGGAFVPRHLPPGPDRGLGGRGGGGFYGGGGGGGGGGFGGF